MNIRTLGALASLTLCLTWSGAAFSATAEAENERFSWSRDYSVKEQRNDKTTAKSMALPALEQQGFRSENGPVKPQTRHSTCNNCAVPSVTLGAAEVELLYDDDRDGFYHHFEVSFDVTSDMPDVPLYARLFLSFEGGAWNFLYRTSDFFLTGDPDEDRRIIETVLDGGYPAGYYDAKIELFDADTNEFLLDLRSTDERDLRAIPLEDVERDDYGYNDNLYFYGHGGGSTGIGALLMLLGFVLLRHRFPAPVSVRNR